MPYKDTKVYFDDGHYIAIPPENFPSRKRKRHKPKPTKPKPPTDTKLSPTPKDKFETAYKESLQLTKRERRKYIAEQLEDTFKSKEETADFVAQNIERKKNNAYKRYTRLWRKVNLQAKWNYFVTFTFDNAIHTEESFKKKLRNTLKHAVNRNGWKYIGVFERSPDKERLHFHGIFYIPENAMIGGIVVVKD